MAVLDSMIVSRSRKRMLECSIVSSEQDRGSLPLINLQEAVTEAAVDSVLAGCNAEGGGMRTGDEFGDGLD